MQLSLAREQLRSFLTQLEQPNPYHESSDIRGFYFTSGTQEGQPLDRVLSEMRDACGLQADEDNQVEEPVDKKAYFIDDLFTQVVFPDKELARSSASAEKRRELLRRIGTISTIAATVLLSIVLIVTYTSHSSLIERAIQTYAAAEAFDRSNKRAIEAEEEPMSEVGGPFEQLRVLFEELDQGYGALGTLRHGPVGRTLRQAHPAASTCASCARRSSSHCSSGWRATSPRPIRSRARTATSPTSPTG